MSRRLLKTAHTAVEQAKAAGATGIEKTPSGLVVDVKEFNKWLSDPKGTHVMQVMYRMQDKIPTMFRNDGILKKLKRGKESGPDS